MYIYISKKKYILKFMLIMSLLTILEYSFLSAKNIPTISIITSIYKADSFIKHFLENIVQQTIFDKCELILVNANSPGKESVIITPYLKKYSNIIYKRLSSDPGLYGVWNYGVSISSGKYITNANVDDLRFPSIIEQHAFELDNNLDIDLVYSDFYYANIPNQNINNYVGRKSNVAEFSPKNMKVCLPGPFPMWRKSMHEKIGLFNSTFIHHGDWDLWLRAVAYGLKFKKCSELAGIYYFNPRGLSTDKNTKLERGQEINKIRKQYDYLWSS